MKTKLVCKKVQIPASSHIPLTPKRESYHWWHGVLPSRGVRGVSENVILLFIPH